MNQWPKWVRDQLKLDNKVADLKFRSEVWKRKNKDHRRDELANKIADLVVKKLNKN